jgi:triphosphatase
MQEVELKFLLDPGQAKALHAAIAKRSLSGRPRTKTLRSIYFDTQDHSLSSAGIALRLRREGRSWVQTVKSSGALHGGLSCVRETTCRAPSGVVSLARIDDGELQSQIREVVGSRPLVPVFETLIRRSACIVALEGGGSAEAAIDVGEIVSKGRSQAIDELELELVEGDPAALYRTAAQLLPGAGLQFSLRTKAARGFALANGEDPFAAPAVRRGKNPAWPQDASLSTAGAAMLRECFLQVFHNMRAILDRDAPEGPHQLRIGLRRMRSVLPLLGGVMREGEAERLADEAKWLFSVAGRQRDLDVCAAILAKEAEDFAHEEGIGELARRVAIRAWENRPGLRTAILSARAQEFLLDLARIAGTGLALDDADPCSTQGAAQAGLQVLARRWRKTRRTAADPDSLSIEQRHELRKELKKLRYCVEFLLPALPRRKARQFLVRLRSLQEVFGEMNDVQVLRHVLDAHAGHGDTAPKLQRAIGFLLGLGEGRSQLRWQEAARAWKDLKKSYDFT